MNPHTQKMPNVHLINNIPQTDSLNVATVFGRPHKDVLNSIKQLGCSEGFNERNFSPVEYTDLKGEKRPMYEMTFDGFVFLVMGFTGAKAAAFKETYINAFNVMELELRNRHLELESNMAEVNLNLQDELLGMKDEMIVILKEQLAAAPKKRVCKPITPEDRKNIYSLHLRGLNGAEIGAEVARSAASVRSILMAFREGLWDELKIEVEQQASA